MYNTLIRVVSVEKIDGKTNILVNIPAWNPHISVKLPEGFIPKNLVYKLQENFRFSCKVNIGVEDDEMDKLKFEDLDLDKFKTKIKTIYSIKGINDPNGYDIWSYVYHTLFTSKEKAEQKKNELEQKIVKHKEQIKPIEEEMEEASKKMDKQTFKEHYKTFIWPKRKKVEDEFRNDDTNIQDGNEYKICEFNLED